MLATQSNTEGAPGSSLELSSLNLGLGVASGVAFFLSVSHPQKPFTRANNRSTADFDHSMKNT
jgi:hypothetical protein